MHRTVPTSRSTLAALLVNAYVTRSRPELRMLASYFALTCWSSARLYFIGIRNNLKKAPPKTKASKQGTSGTQKKGTAAKAARSMIREDDSATAKGGSNNQVVRF